jgi:hypothetical protein
MHRIIINASSPSHLFFLLPYINENFYDVSLIWTGKKETIDSIKNYIKLPRNIYFFTFKYIPFWIPSICEVIRYKSFLKKNFIKSHTTNYKLFIPFNTSMHIKITQRILKIRNDDIYLYDDGMAGFLESRTKLVFLKTIFTLIHGFPYFVSPDRLFSDKSVKNGISINPDLVYKGKNKNINICDSATTIRSSFQDVYKENCKNSFEPNSALILTHHSIESKRMNKKDYFNRINLVIKKIKGKGINNIYFSMHHAENLNKKYDQYISLGLIPYKSQSLPAEVLCCSNNLKIIAQPFNSVVFMAGSLGLLDNKTVISYHLDNQALINDRVISILKIVEQRKIQHIILN